VLKAISQTFSARKACWYWRDTGRLIWNVLEEEEEEEQTTKPPRSAAFFDSESEIHAKFEDGTGNKGLVVWEKNEQDATAAFGSEALSAMRERLAQCSNEQNWQEVMEEFKLVAEAVQEMIKEERREAGEPTS
jgi:hypothetical protein